MTGGDTLTARFMRQDDFEFKPQFKPLISANHKPQLRSVDVAMRRRMHLIPFLVTIPPEKRDSGLKAKLKDEGPGILQWLIEGCLEYQRIGLAPPKSVVDATDEYFKNEDSIANWIEERCEVGKGLRDPSSKLFASWKDYAEKAGLFVGNTKWFKGEMNRLGYRDKKLSFGKVYEGLCACGRTTPAAGTDPTIDGCDPRGSRTGLTAGEEGQFPALVLVAHHAGS